MTEDRRFYVYLHRRNTDGSVFYVGKGCGGRINHTHGKSKWWKSIAVKDGWFAEKVFENLTEECAFSIERILIHVNREFLCNISHGGMGGLSGVKKSEEHIMRVAMAHRGMKRGADTRKKISEMAKLRLSDPKNHPRAKLKVSMWIGPCGCRMVCDHMDLAKSRGMEIEPLKRLQKGIIKSHRGWTCRDL